VFVRVWRFRPRGAQESEFNLVYGENGAWVKLFRVAAGYRGTELRRVSTDPSEYLTIDRWDSRAAWDAFLREHAARYEDLDRQTRHLTEQEQLVEERDE
jgi:heme-degrading monooxygenase HmoA